MKKYVYSKQDINKLLRVEDAEPKCGEAFCDRCGDCLHCYPDDCYLDENGEHFWVEYEDEPIEAVSL